jgi:hypothetical protein
MVLGESWDKAKVEGDEARGEEGLELVELKVGCFKINGGECE